MKNIFLSFFLLLGFTTAQAQGYESIFGTQSTQWNIAIELLDAGYHTEVFSTGDTVVVNNHTYRNLLNFGNPTYFLVREDTTSGKVWVSDGITETLVSDMELAIGDSILLGNGALWSGSSPYAKVDSIYFLNSRKHLQLNRSFYYNPQKRIQLIEGIGPTSGILQAAMISPIAFGTYNHRLVCAHKDGDLIYADSALFDPQPCLYNPVGLEEDLKKAEIKVYPNPSSDLITFALDNYLNERVSITLLDRLGRTVQEVTSTLNNPVVNTAEMPNGIYFYRLAVNGKPLASGKISVSK